MSRPRNREKRLKNTAPLWPLGNRRPTARCKLNAGYPPLDPVVSGGISVTCFLAKDEIMTESEIKKAHCANCKGSRNCDIRGEFDDGYSDEVVTGNTKWLILQCRGCETVFVQTVSTNSEDYDYAERQYGEPDIE